MFNFYKANVNKLDTQLKKVLTDISYKDIPNGLLVEGNNKEKNIPITIFVESANFTDIITNFNWGYYSDKEKTNLIKFNNTSFDKISEEINNIFVNERFNKGYISYEPINEDINVDEVTEGIDQSFTLKEDGDYPVLEIDSKKFIEAFSDSYRVEILEFLHRANVGGDVLDKMYDPEFKSSQFRLSTIGDIAELEIEINSLSYDGNIPPIDWLDIERMIKNLPYVSEIWVNTNTRTVDIEFENDVYVTLK